MTTALRVAVVAGAYEPRLDGVSDYTARLVAELRGRGVDAEVVARQPRDDWTLPGVRRAAAAVRDADLVHVQFAPSAYGWHGQIGLLPLALRHGPPVVVTLHEYGWWSWPPHLPATLWRSVERRGRWDRETALLAPRAAALIVTNSTHAQQLTERLPRVTARVHRIPIGANVGVLGPPRPVHRSGQTVVFFGFVHPVKGMPYLLDALALLRAQGRPVRLEVVGGFTSLALPEDEAATYRREVEAMIAQRGLMDAVELVGWVPPDEVSRRLSAADVAVFPFTAGVTRKSGSLLSALEHGLPTVVTAASPPDPGLHDGTDVVAVPRRDGHAIAAAVARILDDDALAQRLAGAARRIAATSGWDGAVASHLEIYRRVASSSVATPSPIRA